MRAFIHPRNYTGQLAGLGKREVRRYKKGGAAEQARGGAMQVPMELVPSRQQQRQLVKDMEDAAASIVSSMRTIIAGLTNGTLTPDSPEAAVPMPPVGIDWTASGKLKRYEKEYFKLVQTDLPRTLAYLAKQKALENITTQPIQTGPGSGGGGSNQGNGVNDDGSGDTSGGGGGAGGTLGPENYNYYYGGAPGGTPGAYQAFMPTAVTPSLPMEPAQQPGSPGTQYNTPAGGGPPWGLIGIGAAGLGLVAFLFLRRKKR